jgi:hypothetical protein
MRNRVLTITALTLLAGCAGRDRNDTARADSLGRDLELAPAESTVTLNDQPAAQPEPAPPPVTTTTTPRQTRPSTPAPRQTTEPTRPPAAQPTESAPRPNVAPAPYILPAGTAITASATDSINSRTDKVGETVTARIPSDVRDQNGRVIIPAGSTAKFTITALAPAENKSATQGTITLQLTSINVRGRDYPVSGSTTSVEHTLQGRGVTTGDAAKVGAGAAAGAIAGRILGGKKGTVIGGVVGAAVGTGVAVETADRDVVVAPGNTISFTLGEELVVANN